MKILSQPSFKKRAIEGRRKNSSFVKGGRGILSFFFLLIFITGCTLPAYQPPSGARLSISLSVPEVKKSPVTLKIGSITLISEDGKEIELLKGPLVLEIERGKSFQRLILEKEIPSQRYVFLSIMIEEAFLNDPKGSKRLDLISQVKRLDLNINLSKAQAKTIFLRFLPDLSVRPEGFEPVFSIEPERVYASTNLLFVVNEGSDTVSVIDRLGGELIDTISVKKRPKALCAGRLNQRTVLYVANSATNSISIIDPEKRTVDEEILLRRGVEPVSIASGELSNKREVIFTANFRSNNVSVIDPVTLQEIDSITVGSGPVRVIVDPPVEKFLEFSFLNERDREELRRYRERFFNVYVANYYSNSISVIKIDNLSGRILDTREIKVGWNPVNIYMDPQRGKLYVANYGSDYISMIDIPGLLRGEMKSLVISNAGREVVSLFVESEFNRLYLLRATGEVRLLRLPSYKPEVMESQMPSVLGIIYTGGRPGDFLVSLKDNRIYVIDRQRGVLSIFDRLRERFLSDVPTGKEPVQIIELTNLP